MDAWKDYPFRASIPDGVEVYKGTEPGGNIEIARICRIAEPHLGVDLSPENVTPSAVTQALNSIDRYKRFVANVR